MVMRRIALAVLIIIGIGLAQNEVQVHVFYGVGCPHCGSLISYLESIQPDHPYMIVTTHEVYQNDAERELFISVSKAFQAPIEGVPTTFVDDEVFVGAGSNTMAAIEQRVVYCHENGCTDPLERLVPDELPPLPEDISIIGGGDVSIAEQSMLTMPVLLGAAAVDAINPCAFAVLILLLSTIVAAGSRARALKAGLSFTASIYISYLLMGLGIFTVLQASGLAYLFYKVVGFLAILVGLFNIKDFIKIGALGFVMEVPLSWRPRMKGLIKGVTSVPGAFLIGLVVSLFLLPCTSGPYIVILGMLANQATQAAALPLLLLYNFVFIVPMLMITTAVYFGLATPEKAEAWRKTKIRYLHLVAGLILIGMGAVILLGFI